MYARSTAIRAERTRLAEAIDHVRDEVMSPVLGMGGCVGLSLLVDRESGACLVTTAWQDEQSMAASDVGVQPLRDRTAELFGGPATVDRWEIAAVHRAQPSPAGGYARVTWLRSVPARLHRLTDFYAGTVVPTLEQHPGFCSASLFVDRAEGRAVTTVGYVDREALRSSRGMARELRSTAVQENDVRVEDVVEYEIALAHLRVPETV